MPRVKKTPETAAAPKTETAPKAKRTSASRTKTSVAAFVEYQGKQVDLEQLAASIQASWTGEAIKSLKIYVKPEDGAAYYVVNGGEGGKVEF